MLFHFLIYSYNISVWNWSSTMNIWSSLWILMAWWISTKTSVATVLNTHPCVSSCLWVNSLRPGTHICVRKLSIIGSDNGLSPGRRQAIIWTNAGILLIGPLEANFSEILIGIQTFSFRKMHLKISSAKWRPFCLGLNELKVVPHGSPELVFLC